MTVNVNTEQQAPEGEEATAQQAPATVLPLPQADAPAAPPSLPETSEQTPKRDFFKDAFAQSMGRTTPENPPAPPASTPPAEADATEKPDTQAGSGQPNRRVRTKPEAAAPPPPAQAPQQVITPEELDRRVQAETDRRLEKWNREQARIRQEREEKDLRSKDPYAYARLMEQREQENSRLQQQLEAATTFASTQVRTYDTAVLDPLLTAVSEPERKRILSNVPPGMPGRATVAREAIKTIRAEARARGRAEARKELIQDQAFIKEVLARYGGQRQEPDSNPAMQSSQRPLSMSDRIRIMSRGGVIG